MSPHSSPPLFGDALALARASWIREMRTRLAVMGLLDYRRSDPLTLRWLLGGPVALGTLTNVLGASRQAARKVVSGLVERGLARVDVNDSDSRRRNVELTASGRDYAGAVVRVMLALNDELEASVETDQLAAARAVLGYVNGHFGL